MKKYNPAIHARKSIRLKGYDYAQAGLYLVTICVQNRACLFGDIRNGMAQLNDAGKMISKWYMELENKFPDIKCGEHIVMPNHFHCIIHNIGTDGIVGAVGADFGADVGADLRVCPTPDNIQNEHDNNIQNEHNNNIQNKHDNNILGEHDNNILGEHVGSPLGRVVQWFKTMTTNEYIRNVKTNDWKRFNGKLWQRNYWEHIIRNEKSHRNISQYIINNPVKWEKDKLNSRLR